VIARRALPLAAALGVAAFGACGGGQTQGAAFDPRWTSDDGAGIAAFQREFAGTAVPAGADVAVGVTGSGRARKLVGVSLSDDARGARWTFAHALDARPALAGSVVVGLGRGELFALDARSGRLLWKRNAGGRLRGAGDDGQTTVVSLARTIGSGSVVLAIDHDGYVLRQIEDEAAIGVPAVVGRYAFLPWHGQYVTVFDLQTGVEVARALLRSDVSRAFTSGGAIFFGGAAATRFDGSIGRGAAGRASTVALASRELPGAPVWMASGTEVLAPEASAADKTRLYARPVASGAPAIDAGRFAATYFHVAVGLDATSGAVAWARAAEADFLGGAAYAGGFALCDARGEVTLLDAASGAEVGRASLGGPVESCVVQTDSLTPPARAEPRRAAEPLVEQLERVVSLPETELMAMQRLLLRALASLPDDGATKALIDVASAARTPPLLADDARKALATRRSGVGFMLDALRSSYDFLAVAAAPPPPVGPLADALAAMGDKRAAPLLARHLNDPETSPDDLERVAAALVVLAGPDELPALRTFFALYRGVGDEALAEPVVSVAKALVKLGDAGPVQRAAGDAFTSPGVRERLVP
jgi:outer membrane protein assembly factor BamB